MTDINKVAAVGAKGLSGKEGASPPVQYNNGFSDESKGAFAKLDNKVGKMREGSSQQGVTG